MLSYRLVFFSDDSLVYVDYNTCKDVFNFVTTEEEADAVANDATDTLDTASMKKEQRTLWTRDQILKLISLVKEKRHLFDSSTIKNDKVWSVIANELSTHTSEQCKNKWKYLKMKYNEKKDNMKNTGAKCIRFEFFQEIDAIYFQDPTVQPVSLASSSKKRRISSDTNTDCSETVFGAEDSGSAESSESLKKLDTPKSAKKSKLEKQLSDIEENAKRRETERERRHREDMAMKQSAIDAFKDAMKQLVNKLK